MFLNTVSDICGFAVIAAAADVCLNTLFMWIGIAVPGATLGSGVVTPVANAMLVSYATVSTVAPIASHLEKNFIGSSYN